MNTRLCRSPGKLAFTLIEWPSVRFIIGIPAGRLLPASVRATRRKRVFATKMHEGEWKDCLPRFGNYSDDCTKPRRNMPG